MRMKSAGAAGSGERVDGDAELPAEDLIGFPVSELGSVRNRARPLGLYILTAASA